MPLSPQRHRLAGNQALTNADQTVTRVDTRLTRVDTRLTRVDKTDHRQLPPQFQTPAKHSTIATTLTIPPPPASTLPVNPSGASRTTLNTVAAHLQRPTSPLVRGEGLNEGEAGSWRQV